MERDNHVGPTHARGRSTPGVILGALASRLGKLVDTMESDARDLRLISEGQARELRNLRIEAEHLLLEHSNAG